MSDAPRAHRLLGARCVEVGSVEGVAQGACAIALSRGGAAKVYDHTEPNEDAAAFAEGAGGVLLAVADGHDGAHGAEAAIAAVVDAIAPAACAATPPVAGGADAGRAWNDWLYAALQTASARAIADAAARRLPPAPTTLAIALVRPGDDLVAWAGVGDSHVLACAAERVEERGWAALGAHASPHFLGLPEETWHRANTALGCAPLGGLRALALATDGLSEVGIGVDHPEEAVAEALAVARGVAVPPACRAQRFARALAEAALAAHRRRRSGDNVAVAAWVAPDAARSE
ncbi:MAG: protein phosphatase 2C domain-containing protein [Myxococcota bacterium]